jgi:hypothetical protein
MRAGAGGALRASAPAGPATVGSPWARALVLVLLLNAAFTAAALAVAAMPREPLRERVRTAFATGALVERDWLAFDVRRGMHQYDECLILQMLTNEPARRVVEAMGPTNLTRDASYADYCSTLHALVVEGEDPAGFTYFPYTRYWHGYLPVTASMLAVAEIDTARRLLHTTSYLSCLLLFGVALRRRGLLRITGIAIAAGALLAWGLPYYGQLFAHAPGDIVVVLGVVMLVAGGGRLLPAGRLVPLAAAFGAVVVYLEFLTGQIPTAAAFLFATAYALRREAGAAAHPAAAWRTAALALAAFAAGGLVTLLLKQALALAALGSGVVPAFSGSLQRYMGSAPPGGAVPDLLRPFSELFRWGRVLTYNSVPAATALYTASLLAWAAALILGLRQHLARRDPAIAHDVAALALAAAIIIAWVLVLQNHTYYHARFMVRMTMVPVALSAAAAAWAVVSAARLARGSR